MKKILLTLISLSLFTISFAQKTLPEIKKGSALSSSVFVSGQEYPLTLTIKSLSGPVSIGWSVDGYGDGSFEMSDKALESATKMSAVAQPALGLTKLGDDETFSLISKAAYKTLADTKEFTYNGIKFKVKASPTPMKIDDKEIDVTHVVSADGKFEFWILNNPTFPLVVQSTGMPTDIVVNSIK